MIPELGGRAAALLVHASIDGAVAVGLVAAASLLLARRAPGLRCRLWWVACCKALVGLAGIAPLALPILPAAVARAATAVSPLAAIAAPATAAPLPGWPWPVWLAAGWIAGVAIACAVVLGRYRHTRRIVRGSRPAGDPAVLRLLAELSRVVGLRSAPELRFAVEIASPQVVGVFRPVVLLPAAGIQPLSEADLAMTLCHELVHVRRRDLALGWIPAIAARLFFFHPGVVLAAREYALAREEACDAEVLRVLGVTPAHYGRLLVSMTAGSRRTLAPAVGVSSSFRHLRRRLQMLEHAPVRTVSPTTRWVLLALVAAAVLIPVRLVARTPQEAKAAAEKAGDAYVLFLDKDSVTMSGSLDDLAAARAVRDTKGGPLLWFRQDGRVQVITDPAVLRSFASTHGVAEDRALQARRAQLDAERKELGARVQALSRDRGTQGDRERHEELARAEAYAADAARLRQQAQIKEEMERAASHLDSLGLQQEAIARELERVAMENDRRIRELLEERIRSGAAPRDGVEGGVEGGVDGGVDGGVESDGVPPEVI